MFVYCCLFFVIACVVDRCMLDKALSFVLFDSVFVCAVCSLLIVDCFLLFVDCYCLLIVVVDCCVIVCYCLQFVVLFVFCAVKRQFT